MSYTTVLCHINWITIEVSNIKPCIDASIKSHKGTVRQGRTRILVNQVATTHTVFKADHFYGVLEPNKNIALAVICNLNSYYT